MKYCDDTSTAVPLTELEPGQSGKVVEVGNSVVGFGRRLRDLGFVPGSVVRVHRRAPLKDPVEYEIRNSRVCLRRSEAAVIGVLLTPSVIVDI